MAAAAVSIVCSFLLLRWVDNVSQVYRVALLYRLRRIASGADGKVFITKSVNPLTGLASRSDTNFSALNFGVKTRQCASSASRLSPASLDSLLDTARQRVNSSRRMLEREASLLSDEELATDFSKLVESD